MDPAKIVHLYNLAHYDCLGPVLSRHAVTSDNFIYNSGVTPPATHSHCDACGIRHLPGLTSSTRIKFTKGKARSRMLCVTCLVCQHTRTEKCLLDKKPVKVEATTKVGKKRRNDLSSMLAKQKQLKANEKKTTLSLMEFMQ